MVIGHDFKRFPELTNNQLDLYYFSSPHKQIFEDFVAKVIKVHDGDTITLRWSERDFDFPLRFLNISAREMKETGARDTSFQMSKSGPESQSWLEQLILNEEVEIKMHKVNRVEKFGRLLGRVFHKGMDVGELSVLANMSTAWDRRSDGQIPEGIKEIK